MDKPTVLIRATHYRHINTRSLWKKVSSTDVVMWLYIAAYTTKAQAYESLNRIKQRRSERQLKETEAS